MSSRVTLVFALLFSLAGPALALQLSASEGEASFGFLKLSLSPRSVGLGGGGVALVGGIVDADLNPAAPARDSGGVAAGQIYLPSFSATGSFAAWNIPVDDYRITAQARYLGYDNIPGYDGNDAATAAYGAHLIKLQTGVAGSLAGFDYGASVAIAENNIADQTYGAGLLNLGLWRGLSGGFAAGVSLMNVDFWTSKAADGTSIIAPVTIQAGAAYSREAYRNLQVSVTADVRKRNDESVALPVGVEACWQNILSVRLGYPVAEQNAAPTFGLGLQWSRFGFEYAYQGNAEISATQLWALEIRY